MYAIRSYYVVLIGAGLPLVDAIETLAETERRDDFRAALGQIAGSLRQGQAFSAALAQLPHVFSPLYVATVRAAERVITSYSIHYTKLYDQLRFRADIQLTDKPLLPVEQYAAQYTGPGLFNASLRVEDSAGNFDQASVLVRARQFKEFDTHCCSCIGSPAAQRCRSLTQLVV